MASSISDQPFYPLLNVELQNFLADQAEIFRFSVQDNRQVCEIALDMQMWGNENIQNNWPDVSSSSATGKALKQQLMGKLHEIWQLRKNQHNQYPDDSKASKISAAAQPCAVKKEKLGLGRCPVASPRTLCCNLQTLDAVDNCGYGCSYCSIQSFYQDPVLDF